MHLSEKDFYYELLWLLKMQGWEKAFLIKIICNNEAISSENTDVDTLYFSGSSVSYGTSYIFSIGLHTSPHNLNRCHSRPP